MCGVCSWITVSDQVPHRMDFCKCKKHQTGVDHEVGYTRISGSNYKFIALIDADKGTIEKVAKKDGTSKN